MRKCLVSFLLAVLTVIGLVPATQAETRRPGMSPKVVPHRPVPDRRPPPFIPRPIPVPVPVPVPLPGPIPSPWFPPPTIPPGPGWPMLRGGPLTTSANPSLAPTSNGRVNLNRLATRR
jgi:hypothetical protein